MHVLSPDIPSCKPRPLGKCDEAGGCAVGERFSIGALRAAVLTDAAVHGHSETPTAAVLTGVKCCAYHLAPLDVMMPSRQADAPAADVDASPAELEPAADVLGADETIDLPPER